MKLLETQKVNGKFSIGSDAASDFIRINNEINIYVPILPKY